MRVGRNRERERVEWVREGEIEGWERENGVG